MSANFPPRHSQKRSRRIREIIGGGACETYCESFDTERRVIIHLAVLSRTRAPLDMDAPEWKWTPVQGRLPGNAQTVAIKFWDGNGVVRYGIGYYNAKEQRWVVTAEPNLFDGFLVPMEWMALPD